VRPVKPSTIAKSLAIGNPADGGYALDVVRRTGGAVGSVTDDEIVDGIRLLARTEGIFAETAGGVTVATLVKLVDSGVVKRDERVVVYVTGSGLKTVEALVGRVSVAEPIGATLDDVARALNADFVTKAVA
jgi:threonine synthase